MRANPSLQLRLSQKLALAPQLQQAIRLLQLNRIELREHIQELVDGNPLLEHDDFAEQTDQDQAENSPADALSEFEHDKNSQEDFSNEFESDQWSADNTSEPWAETSGWSDEFSETQISDTSSDSLHEHLLAQIRLAHFNEVDTAIATAIVYALDEDGFLSDQLAEIRGSLLPELQVEESEIKAVLHRVQRLEPVGVASRSTAECIQIQLRALPASTPGNDLALRLARDFLDLVAANAYQDMLKETSASPDGLKQALELIRALEPRPGKRYDNRRDEYLVPDVYVRKEDNKWVTTLSPDSSPSLKLNTYYITLLRKSGGEDAEYLRGRLQEARWLLSSLELRNRTLLNVSQAIVDAQQEFLADGECAMKPLILKDISEIVGVHESTVSRATTHKYMLTPRGIFELKYFFSSHVRTLDGGLVSAVATKARIQVFIENEPPTKPLSDQEISLLLRETGTCAARRTVAKYRESLGIGSSSERRRMYNRNIEF